MWFRFFAADKPREYALAQAVGQGIRDAGHTFDILPSSLWARTDECDVACIWGVKNPSRALYERCMRTDKRFLFFDKGITMRKGRDNRYRVSLDALYPTKYLMRKKRNADRFRSSGVWFGDMEAPPGAPALLLGSSQKAHDWHPDVYPRDAMQYYDSLAMEIGPEPVIWRPKPSWRAAEPIPGTLPDPGGPLEEVLRGVSRVICTGSSGSFYAIAAGVPVRIMRGFSNIAIPIEHLPFDVDTRWQFCANVCYTEWTLDEYRGGQWWDELRGLIE